MADDETNGHVEKTGYVLAVGNPFDGVSLHCRPDGRLFDDADEAAGFAEANFDDYDWWIVDVEPCSDDPTH